MQGTHLGLFTGPHTLAGPMPRTQTGASAKPELLSWFQSSELRQAAETAREVSERQLSSVLLLSP